MQVRWGIAAQDIVFPAKDSFVQSFMTCGQVMPVHRGGGIDQALFLDFARQMAAGRWVHVFPEARVVQTGLLATDAITKRSEKELEDRGKLKWGTGKLIAHSLVPPVVIPFYRGVSSLPPLPPHRTLSHIGASIPAAACTGRQASPVPDQPSRVGGESWTMEWWWWWWW